MIEGTKVYERKDIDVFGNERGYYGMNQSEMEEAMQLYTDKLKRDIFTGLQEDFGFTADELNKEAVRRLFHFIIDKAFTEGMELGGSPSDLASFYREAKNRRASSMVKDYEFEPEKGVCGVLFPDGTFVKCGNAEHYLLMEDIPMETQFGCVYFSSMMRGEGDGIITTSPVKFNGVTEDQRHWMEMNFDYLDRGQQRRAHFDWEIRKGDNDE